MSIMVAGFSNKNKKKGVVEFDEVKKDKFVEELNNLEESNRCKEKKISKLKYKTIKNLCFSSAVIPNKLKISNKDLNTMDSIMKDNELIDYLENVPLNEEDYENYSTPLKNNFSRFSPVKRNIEYNILSPTPKGSFSRHLLTINQVKTTSQLANCDELFGVNEQKLINENKLVNSLKPIRINKVVNDGNEDHFTPFKRKKLPKTVLNLPQVSFSPKNREKHKDINNSNKREYNSYSPGETFTSKNPVLKRLLYECNEYGPYCKGCHTCNSKNQQFFQKMNTESALLLLNYIKKKRDDYYTLSSKNSLY